MVAQCWHPVFVSKNGNDYKVFYTNINEVIKPDFCNNHFQLSICEIKENFRIFPFFLEKIDLEDILDRAVSELFSLSLLERV